MSEKVDICIRGAGIVGRSLALLLARERFRVALVEQPRNTDSGHADVRAYALNAAARQLLLDLRAWPDEADATPVVEMQVHGGPEASVRFHAATQGVDALNWIVDVPALEQRLAEAVRYQPLIQVVTEPVRATLTAVCEGKASRTRAEFGVHYDVTPYDQQAIATRLVCEQPHGQVARQWFNGPDILAFLPLGGPHGNSVAVVWSVLQQDVNERLALSPEDFAARLRADSHDALGALTLSSDRVVWPLQRATADHWCGTGPDGAWVLAGDAAHTVHPLAGQGLNLGLADVAELARVLHERDYWREPGDMRLLRRYERARRADVMAMGLTTDGLQRLFSREEAPWKALRQWGMKGFDHSGWIKHWVARQAMGLR